MRRDAPLLLLACLLLLPGCSSGGSADRLVIAPDRYSDAFDAASSVVRDLGLPPELRSRRAGIIETTPVRAPSVLEPWASDGSRLARRWEGTVSQQRRRARIEFAQVDARPPAAPRDEAEPLRGPDVLGLADDVPNLIDGTSDLELRVWVFVERAHHPGVRRSTWSRQLTSRSTITPPRSDEPLPATFWTPVARDQALEQRIVAEIERRLAAAAG
jgi:hypothetical protein